MKRSITSLIGYSIKAIDGDIGKIKEFFFDDESWTVRFLIVKTGNWLTGRRVFISPEALIESDWDKENLLVNLTREQIRNSPDIDIDNPFSQQQELQTPLHSTRKVIGYSINAVDGVIGKIDDFIFNDRNWELDFMVVDKVEWNHDEKVIISPKRIKEIKWESSAVTVNTMVELVKDSPEYDPNMPIGDVYEADLENHYNGFVCHKR